MVLSQALIVGPYGETRIIEVMKVLEFGLLNASKRLAVPWEELVALAPP